LTLANGRFTLSSMPRRTALIVAVPEAEPAVGDLRLRHDSSAAKGVPAHVTILFPFAPPDAIDEDALRGLFARFPAFEFALDRVETFDEGVVWLRPQPMEPFADLTAAVYELYPDYPPYEGAHDIVVPHLTVSDGDFVEVDVQLPIAARAHEVTLIEEAEADGRWTVRLAFPLASLPPAA
jgi:2'-5' RNA ligase superfamily